MPKLVLEGVFRVEHLEIEAATLAEVKDVLDHIGVKGTYPRSNSNGTVGVANGQVGYVAESGVSTTPPAHPVAEAPKRGRPPKRTEAAEAPKEEQLEIPGTDVPPPATRARADAVAAKPASETPAARPAARAAGAKGKIDMEKLQGAGRLREVVAHLLEVGYGDLKEIVAVCEDLQDSVPILQRCSDIPNRVQVAYDVCKDAGGKQAQA